MAYCNNCKVRAVYQNGLCYECNQKMGQRRSSPHGAFSYNKYSPEMSKIIKEPEQVSGIVEKRRKEKKQKSESPIIMGVPLYNEICNDYNLIWWKHPSEKPELDENKIEYYYITVKPYSKSKKIQVKVEHENKRVYLSAVKLTKVYTQAARMEIMSIISGDK